jgi:hypothetical protein
MDECENACMYLCTDGCMDLAVFYAPQARYVLAIYQTQTKEKEEQ